MEANWIGGVGFVTPKQRREALMRKASKLVDDGATITAAVDAIFEEWTGVAVNGCNDGDFFIRKQEGIARYIRRYRETTPK